MMMTTTTLLPPRDPTLSSWTSWLSRSYPFSSTR